mmetsp:Transcript_131059/g.261472  ORF Transcript_131059/g.261472 Transcript_131059/m.261472 type:complete len:147 (+) Transcript_131059:68-508(+)
MLHHDPHFEQNAPENDGSLAYRLEDYLTSAGFLRELDSFVQRHCNVFQEVEDGGEHRHEWFQAFREYERMVDDRVEAFLRSEQTTAEEAVAQCLAAQQAGKEHYKFFEYLAAATEYEQFHRLMMDFKTRRRDLSEWWTCLARHSDS